MHNGNWSDIDTKNKELLESMLGEGKIAFGLIDNNRAITLNYLIEFCKNQNIDFDKPILLECPDGYFPLAHFHNGEYVDDNENPFKMNMLVIRDGEW